MDLRIIGGLQKKLNGDLIATKDHAKED